MDYPENTCANCSNSYHKENEDPVCWESECPTGFDTLPDEAKRLLNIRGMLNMLSEAGLSKLICTEFNVTAEDLGYLVMMEAECRELAKFRKGNDGDS